MTFEQALEALKDGKKVAREDWDGDDLLANDWYILGEEEKQQERLSALARLVMEIPTSVKVGNYVYMVDLTDDELFLDGQRCFGTVDYNNHTIRINKNAQDDQGLFVTFLHELVHAILNQRNVFLDSESEETVVEALARGLHGVLVDNDGLF